MYYFFNAITSPYTSAGSKNKKALKAYRDMLEDENAANEITGYGGWGIDVCKFDLIDINKDGVNELIFTPDDGYHVSIVAYVNGTLKDVGGGFSGDNMK